MFAQPFGKTGLASGFCGLSAESCGCGGFIEAAALR
jgi:hypothetical protein